MSETTHTLDRTWAKRHGYYTATNGDCTPTPGEWTQALDALAAARAEVEALTHALRGLVDDEPCRFDHHGYCQTHGLSNPCEMKIARDALAAQEADDAT